MPLNKEPKTKVKIIGALNITIIFMGNQSGNSTRPFAFLFALMLLKKSMKPSILPWLSVNRAGWALTSFKNLPSAISCQGMVG